MHSRALLTINSGSSSLKFALFSYTETDSPVLLYQGAMTAIGGSGQFQVDDAEGQRQHEAQDIVITDHAHALQLLLDWLSTDTPALEIVAAGHRVVHGGRRFHAPTLITEDSLAYLQTLTALAPNHQPSGLLGITTLQQLQPDMPQIACFDTAFHHDRPVVERYFALPSRPQLDDVQRYGFHGLSYEYIAKVLPDYLGDRADGKVIVAHLGHGASLCALQQGRSVATTMTFTPLDGIPMGTRCGSIDPAVVLYLQQQGMSPAEVSDLLYFESGLLGVSGETGDMAGLLASNTIQAQRAIEQFVHHCTRAVGSLAAALGGVDTLVFTAGIGEHAAPVRAAICERCSWLGLQLDSEANRLGQPRISKDGSRVAAWVIATDESSMIADHTWRILNLQQQRSSA